VSCLLNVILCDDNQEILVTVRKFIEGFIMMEDLQDIQVELATTNPDEVLDLFREKTVGADGSVRIQARPLRQRILFLDIAFGAGIEYDGVAMGRHIRKFDDSVHIVYLTSYRQVISDVVNYKIMPLGFLNKPVFGEDNETLQKDVIEMLMYAHEKMAMSKVDKKVLEFKTGSRRIYVKLSDVYYIQGNDSKNQEMDEEKKKALTVLSESGGLQYFKKSLKYYDERIPELVKLGKSFLINPLNVVETTTARKHAILKMRNGEQIRVMRDSFLIYEQLVAQLKSEGVI